MTQPYRKDNNRIVKAYFRSGAVLFRGIIQLVYIGCTVGLILSLGFMARDLFLIACNNDYSQLSIYDTSSLISMITSFVGLIPALLIAIAYLIIYGKSRSDAPDSRPDAGITILNVFAILDLIGKILIAVASITVSVVVMIHAINDAKRATQTSIYGNTTPSVPAGVYIAVASAVISGILIIIVPAVYKAYIGGIRDTAKYGALSNTCAKAYGVFAVLRTIGMVFAVVASAALIVLNARLPELVSKVNSEEVVMNFAYYLSSRGMMFFIFLFLIVLSTCITYILDAKIAFGYANHISRALLSPERTDVKNDADPPQPPAGSGFYNRSYQAEEYEDEGKTVAEPRPRVRGYGDHFYDD